jgi:hypothetical protein
MTDRRKPSTDLNEASASQTDPEGRKRRSSGGTSVTQLESTDRWIGSKSEEELLSDLRVYSARLRDSPRSLPDRLRVAAIQLRLGRIDEALVHYEGVLRGYVSAGEILSAIALCERILAIYPDLPRVQRLLAALYARAPHGSTNAVTPVTPVDEVGEFVLEGDDGGARGNVVSRVFSGNRPATSEIGRDLLDSDELNPTLPFSGETDPILLTRPKPQRSQPAQRQETPTGSGGSPSAKAGDDTENEDDSSVHLLTQPKKAE